MEEAIKYGKQLKDFFINELEIHRKNGNYKYEITPKDIYNAFMKGFEFCTKNTMK